MAPTRHPLIDLVFNDETGRYIGHLERKAYVFMIENMRMRVLLELLTGDMWDDQNLEALVRTEDEQIFALAVDALKRRLNLSHEDARKLVDDRWTATQPPPPDPALATYMIGLESDMPHVVTHARRMPVPESGVKFDHKKHLEGLEKSKANRGRAKN
jgi:hypothetical protein